LNNPFTIPPIFPASLLPREKIDFSGLASSSSADLEFSFVIRFIKIGTIKLAAHLERDSDNPNFVVKFETRLLTNPNFVVKFETRLLTELLFKPSAKLEFSPLKINS